MKDIKEGEKKKDIYEIIINKFDELIKIGKSSSNEQINQLMPSECMEDMKALFVSEIKFKDRLFILTDMKNKLNTINNILNHLKKVKIPEIVKFINEFNNLLKIFDDGIKEENERKEEENKNEIKEEDKKEDKKEEDKKEEENKNEN